MNMKDGIDWYSLSHNNYISTTTYTVASSHPPRNLIVDLVFIDEDTVAVGNVEGFIFVATYGVPEVKLSLKLDRFSRGRFGSFLLYAIRSHYSYSAPLQTLVRILLLTLHLRFVNEEFDRIDIWISGRETHYFWDHAAIVTCFWKWTTL